MKPNVNVIVLIAGLLFLAGAMLLTHLTLVSGSYGLILLLACVLAASADVFFLVMLIRGGVAWRVAGGVLILTSLYVFGEAVRRGL